MGTYVGGARGVSGGCWWLHQGTLPAVLTVRGLGISSGAVQVFTVRSLGSCGVVCLPSSRIS